MKNMSMAVGAYPANTLKYVNRDGKTGDGKAKGTLAANPTTIDGIITRAWQEISKGNAANPQQCVDIFIQKHCRALHKIPAVEPLTSPLKECSKHLTLQATRLPAWLAGTLLNSAVSPSKLQDG